MIAMSSSGSNEFDLNKAAEAAKKFALATNSAGKPKPPPPQASVVGGGGGHGWQQFGQQIPQFNPHVPPPGFGFGMPPRPPHMFGYGGNDFGLQGMNFSSPIAQASTAIPQMVPTSSAPSSSSNLGPGSSSSYSAYGNPQPAGSTQTQKNLTAYQQWMQSRQQNKPSSESSYQHQGQFQQKMMPSSSPGGGGPKPIRFQLQPKRGGPPAKLPTSSSSSYQRYPSSASGNVNANQGMEDYDKRGSSSEPLLPTPSGSNSKHPSQQQINNAMDPSDWPPSLQEYVFRCYSLCSTDMDKDRVDIILKGKVIRAASDGVLQSKDWTKEALPEINEGAVKMLPFAPLTVPIKGKITGKPIMLLDYADAPPPPNTMKGRRGRGGGGRGGKRGGKEGRGGGRGRGGGVRNFRSRSTSESSRSRSRSRSPSNSSLSSRDSPNRRDGGKRRRRSSDSPDFYGLSPQKKGKGKGGGKVKNAKKKDAQKGKKDSTQKPVHMYSKFGVMQLDEESGSSVKLNARAARFAKDSPQSSSSGGYQKGPKARPTMKSRLGGFKFQRASAPAVPWAIDTTPSSSSNSWADMTIIGTCTDLEKKYLRLTSAPDASTIRQQSVLKKSLEMVKRKWRENSDYFYACDQLKSIRQDLTVQRIRNEFTVNVYETHARIALEKGDHEEFNQCQSQLVQLYANIGSPFKIEFTAYRILYYIFTASTLDIGTVMSKLTEEEKKDECIAHALSIRSAWAIKNFPKFFKLHNQSPKMAGYLIDWFANRERKCALKIILKAYRPHVPTSFIIHQLGLSNESEWKEFLVNASLENTIIYVDAPTNSKVNSKDSLPLVLSALPQK